MKNFLILLAGCWLAAGPAAAQESPEAALARLERTLGAMASFQADFEQAAVSVTVSEPLRQKGRVYYRRPGAMRWEYGAPEKNIYVLKGGLLLSYLAEDNQLWRQNMPKEMAESEILGLLSGKGGLAEKYIVENSPMPGSAPGSAQIKLTPREEGDYAYILLEIGRGESILKRAVFFDSSGNKQEFSFSRFKAGVTLKDKLFEIQVPPDCEIIDETAPVPPVKK